MKIPGAALLLLLLVQQKPPAELQVSQFEGSSTGAIVITGAQTQPGTPVQQLPAIQIEQNPQQVAGQRFDVRFRGAELRDVLNTLAQGHGLNLVMPDTVSGTVTQDLVNVTLAEALDAILTPRNLQYTIDDNLLRVNSVQMETRMFKFDYITTIRTLSRSVTASSTAGGGGGNLGGGAGGASLGGSFIGGGGGGGGSSTSVSGTETTQLLVDLETAIKSLSSGGVAGGAAAPGATAAATTAPQAGAPNVVFNRMAGIILVTDFPRNLDTIGLYLETIQNAVNRQVIIEAKVVEVKLNEDSQFGINWTAVLGSTIRMEQALGTASAFQITGTIGDFNAVVTALKNQGTVNVRSAPTVATLNNQPAVIRVGTQDIFFTTTTQVDPRTGTIVQTAVTPAAINEGIVLDVTPQISDDGIITMNIHPTITERTGQAVSPRGDSVPIVDVRESDTVLRVADGETVVIAGLISERELETLNKVPVLGDIPFLGGLFRRTTKENRKTDLVILLTPRILNVRTAADYARSRIETQERLKPEQKQ